MTSLPGKHASCWVGRAPATDYPKLRGDVSVDVAVIGGGIVGLTAALRLARAGTSVAVIEARRVGMGVTGHSTAKITSQHGLIYAWLTESAGAETARLYADANQGAIGTIEALVGELGIACGFERADAWVHTGRADRREEFRAEAEAARRLGLPASFETESPLPFPIAGAVRFADQAQFDPVPYLQALARAVAGGGGRVFEGTRATGIEHGDRVRVRTPEGTVSAAHAIVATNLPFPTEGDYHEKAFPRAHLAVAARVPADRAPRGMFLGLDSPTYSVRSAPDGDGRLLVVIGPSYRHGHLRDTGRLYREIAAWVRERFGVEAPDWRWRNEDYDSRDRVPFVGPISADHPNVLVATGFCSWGISNGTAAAELLADRILGRENPRAALYDSLREPGRAPNDGQPDMIEEPEDAARPGSPDDLAPGEGARFEIGGEPLGVWRDDAGRLHAVSAECTHLGCKLHWNAAERTWDCHCHGSIFAADGTMVHGPATADLARRDGKE